jgi:hypothetical protein
LQQTSNLVRCELHIFFDANRNHRGPDVTLAHLESLTLISPGRESVPDFLETLIVPALRRLEVPECFLDANPTDTSAALNVPTGPTGLIWDSSHWSCGYDALLTPFTPEIELFRGVQKHF